MGCRCSIERAEVTYEALVAVNASILETFVRSATEAGVIPLGVPFPNKKELEASPLSKRVCSDERCLH